MHSINTKANGDFDEMAAMPATTNDEPDDWALIQDLIARAEKGEQGVLPLLRQALDAQPELWRQAGDLARQAREAQLDLIAEGNLVVRESTIRQLADLQAKLRGTSLTPLEELLIERIVILWLQSHHADRMLHKAEDATVRHRQSLDRRAKGANRRFLHAARQLATVRHLLRRVATAASRRPHNKTSTCHS